MMAKAILTSKAAPAFIAMKPIWLAKLLLQDLRACKQVLLWFSSDGPKLA